MMALVLGLIIAGAALAVAALALLVTSDTRRRSDNHGHELARHLLEHRHTGEYRIPTNGQHDGHLG